MSPWTIYLDVLKGLEAGKQELLCLCSEPVDMSQLPSGTHMPKCPCADREPLLQETPDIILALSPPAEVTVPIVRYILMDRHILVSWTSSSHFHVSVYAHLW